MFRLARVLRSHPGARCVDVQYLDRAVGGYAARVPVLSAGAGSDTGGPDIPTVEPSDGDRPDGAREMIAIVGMIGTEPAVFGFLPPANSQSNFADGRMIYRHQSDTYFTVDKDGNAELYHPSGTFLRIGTPGHEDLSGRDVDGTWLIKRNTSAAPTITLGTAAGGASKSTLTISPSGAVSLSTQGEVAIASQGSTSINATGDVTVSTQGSATVSAQGSASISGGGGLSLASGSGSVSCSGTFIVDGDVIADNISLKTHVHDKVTIGNDDTGQPKPS